MKLQELLKETKYSSVQSTCAQTENTLNTEVTGIAFDSRKVKPGFIFVCIEGSVVDGHKYVKQAVQAGAVAILAQHDVCTEAREACKLGNSPRQVTVILVENTRRELANISHIFYNTPDKRMPIIGITGTKGKSTTAAMVKAILDDGGHKAGLVGTIESVVGDMHTNAERTTPESLELQEMFDKMLEAGNDCAVIEVSSQGLMLSRVHGIYFDTAVFTNVESDHIGPNEHRDFDDYFSWKKTLFSQCKRALINADDEHAQQVIDSCKSPCFTFGVSDEEPGYVCEPHPDFVAYNVNACHDCVHFTVNTPTWSERFELSVPGKFNVSNALAAIGVAYLQGVDKSAIGKALAKFSVKGRTEIVESNERYTVMIDYAHNAMSLESLLKSVREYAKGRIVCVFGCGGDRDHHRRPEMGRVSGKMANFTIITSDNPRSEDPMTIINDIEAGVKETGGSYIKIEQRHDAIKYALEHAQQDDIVILAGKGHETYQIFCDKTIVFDEREVVAEILKEIAQKGRDESK